MQELGGCIAVIAAQGEGEEPYRQDGDFLWLTGVAERDAWLLLAPKAKYDRTVLFLTPRDPERERWTGAREPLSPALKAKLGVDQVRRGRPDRHAVVAGGHTDCITLVAPVSSLDNPRPDEELTGRIAGALGLKTVYKRTLLASFRAAHDEEEIRRLEGAITITRAGHEAAARSTVAGARERDVQREIEYAFLAQGASGLSYGTIVGSGPNGAVLHWSDNTRTLRDGDVVVVDAGADNARYASDVTRTYPVSGRFSEEQARAYRAVYQAQEDIFAAIKPGVSMADLQQVAEQSLEKSGYLEHFIHGFGHFVGLDVHDAGDREAPLPVGAVFTVEPGVYLPEKGFGIRIEDEVLVTPTGYRLLSADIPRKLEDVEAWVARARAAR
jgi:Xaa-Pro aminopeptidase